MPKSLRKLKDWLESYLDYVENSEPDELYKIWVGISVLAAVLQRKCAMDWDSTIYPNMYIVLVGPPGKARKGTALGPAFKLLQELNIKMSASSVTREALIQELEQSVQAIPGESENVISGLHNSLTIFAPELTVFLGVQNHQLMNDLTDWFDCREPWEYKTKNKGTNVIDGVWVNLVGATTPDLIKTSLPYEIVGGGLASRIIFVYAHDKGKIVPLPFLTEKNKELWKDLVHDLKLIHGMKGKFKYTHAFVDAYVEWYKKNETDPPLKDKRFTGYVSRRPTHLRKLCMILSAARSDEMVIDKCDFDRVLKLLERTETRMPLAFGSFGRLNYTDIFHQMMLEISQRKELDYGELLDKFYVDVDGDTFRKMLESLEKMQFIDLLHSPNGSKIVYKGKSKSVMAESLQKEVDKK